MPPKSDTEESPASTSKCRRSARIRNGTKSKVKEQLQSVTEESPASTSKGRSVRVRYETRAKAKGQLLSSNGEASSTNVKGTQGKMTATKRQHANSNERQSTLPVKKRTRYAKMDEIKEQASRMGLQDQEDFATGIYQILGEMSPDLKISEKAIAEMNTYLNHIFECLARTAAVFLLEKSKDSMDVIDIEAALVHVLDGELGKYCLCEGRRAVKLSNTVEIIEISD